MTPKKLILTVLLLIALNLSIQPSQSVFSTREKHSIVHVIELDSDPYMSKFTESNKRAYRILLVSLTAKILATDSGYIQCDSS
jgi:hypothetical protein